MDLKSVRYLYCPNFTYLNTSDKAYNTRQLINQGPTAACALYMQSTGTYQY